MLYCFLLGYRTPWSNGTGGFSDFIAMRINIANPTPYELSEYNRLLDYVYDLDCFESLEVTRGGNGFCSTMTTLNLNTGASVKAHAIYPHSGSVGLCQIKCDILALSRCLEKIGIEVEFIEAQEERIPSVVTKTRLSGCSTLKQIVEVLEEANHPSLERVKVFIEDKRKSGGRPSKKSVVDLVFERVSVTNNNTNLLQATPRRTGMDWANVKTRWKDRFAESKYAKIYKSLDEFCTFALDSEVSEQW